MDCAALFLRETTQRMNDEYLPRLAHVVGELAPEDLWWRPHEGTTSIGILLTHLEGNVRQWILSGLGGAPDRRARDREFETTDERSAQALLDRLRATVEEACGVIARLDPACLVEKRSIQGIETTVLGAVYHVLEHFGWHTGQITWIAKLRRGPRHTIRFYDDERLNAARDD